MKIHAILLTFLALQLHCEAHTNSMVLVWTEILELMISWNAEYAPGSLNCFTLYNFDTTVTQVLANYQDNIPGGFFIANKLENITRQWRSRPLCSGFMARFATKHDAIVFATKKEESGQFMWANSLAVISIEETVNISELIELFESGVFARTPKLVVLCQDALSVYREYSTMDDWIQKSTLNVPKDNELFSNNLDNHFGKKLNVATFDYAPFTTSKPALPGEQPIFDGIEMSILHLVSKALNFTYVLNEPQTGSKFGGVISDLKSQVADIGVCHLFQQYDRIVLLNLDHSSAINMDHYTFLVPQAELLPRWMFLLLPFDMLTWVALTSSLVICLAFALFFIRFEKSQELDFEDYFFTYLAACAEKMWEPAQTVRSNGLRIHLLFVLLALFILTTGYKGSYFSLILSPILLKQMETLEDVLASDLNVFSLSGVLQSNLNADTDPKLIKLAEKSSKHGDIAGALFNVSQGLQVLTESEQMSRYRINLDFIDGSGQQTIHVAQRMRQFAVAFYLQESSPYREPLNRALESLLEAGINDKILKDALNRLEVKNNVKGPEKLSLDGTRPAFVVLILFGLISCLTFLIEINVIWLGKLWPTLRRNLTSSVILINLPDSMA